MSHQHSHPKYIDNIKNTVVLESPVHGYGLFAIKNIPANTLLCKLTGQIIEKKEYHLFLNDNKINKNIFIEKHTISDTEIMVTPFRTKWSYINHHHTIQHVYSQYNPDTKTVDIYSKIDIRKNEEIFGKYNLETHLDILGGFKIKE